MNDTAKNLTANGQSVEAFYLNADEIELIKTALNRETVRWAEIAKEDKVFSPEFARTEGYKNTSLFCKFVK